MAKGGVGGVNTSISKSSISKSSIAKTGITKTSISKTSISKSSSIWVSISSIKDSGFSIGISLSLTLLAATWDSSSKVVGANSDVGRVGQTKRSGSNSVSKSSVGGRNGTVSKSSISKSSISKSGISKTSISKSSSIRVSISSIKDSSLSVSLGLSLGLTLLLAIQTSSIWISSISQRSSSTWDGDISSVHTWCRLATEGIGTICIRMAEAISITSIKESWVSLSFSIDSGDEGRCNNKKLIHFVR